MTEETEGSSTAPGAGAGDPASTQSIPRIPKPVDRPAKPADRPAKQASPAAKKPAAKAASGPGVRPLTTADYVRTTKPSPSTTSVIPAVRDTPADNGRDRQVGAMTFSPKPASGSGRRASLRLTHVEPWSVTTLAFAISVALMIVSVVAAAIFWIVLDFAGVWDQINNSVTSVLSDDSSSFNVTDYLGFGRLVGLTLVLSAVNVVLITALATIGAHLYNLAAQLMGGVEVTFAEDN